MHIEVKLKGEWRHYSTPDVYRNYDLFAKMAGVRGSVEPIANPRGLPNDIDPITAIDYERWRGDAHSMSYLSAEELGQVQAWWKENRYEGASYSPFGYLFGNAFDAWVKYPQDVDELRSRGIEDVRAVFWFDN